MEGEEQESKYLGVGADAIQYGMEKHGFSNNEPNLTNRSNLCIEPFR